MCVEGGDNAVTEIFPIFLGGGVNNPKSEIKNFGIFLEDRKNSLVTVF
jgi:hypothetical protein